MGRSNVPVVLAVCAAVTLLAVNTLTHQSTVWAPSTTLPQRAESNNNDMVSELSEVDADSARINAQLHIALEKIQGEARRLGMALPASKSLQSTRLDQLESGIHALRSMVATTTITTPPPPPPSASPPSSSSPPPPPPPSSSPPPKAESAVSSAPARKACHPGCAKHGTCNEDVGRCDCPPFYGGEDCTTPLFPSCVKQFGFEPPVAACGIHTQPAVPVTCDCVWECHQLAMDARQECVVEPAAGQSMEAALKQTKQQMGWMPVIANTTWLERTRADAQRTLDQKLCSGNGIQSVQLPYEFYPPDGEVHDGPKYGLPPGPVRLRHTPLCRCFPGFTGPNCEVVMSAVFHLHKCLNDCNGRGTCVHNFCKCTPGYWGADCSLGGSMPAAQPAVPASLRPRIYVYDLPPRFTSWIGAFRRGDWTRDHWYGVDVILHQQLLRSPYRTTDPEQADFFFIPLHLSLGYYSHRYYFKHFTTPAVKPLRDAIAYVKTTWPYFARKGGKDHIMVMTQDQGNRFVRQSVPEATPLMLIHHWGAPKKCIVDASSQGDHIPGHDLTVPPFHGEMARLNRWLSPKAKGAFDGAGRLCAVQHAAEGGINSPTCTQAEIGPVALRKEPAESDFRRNLFFSGKMNLNWGRAYALGVRQAVYRAHKNESTMLIMTFDNGVLEKIPFERHVANYAESKFCLAPAGYGFSSRQYECVLVGCVPIIIQDDVEMAFEETLPWRRFGLRLNFSDIPTLPQLLAKVPARHVARLRRGLGCIWPRMLWLTKGLYPANNANIDVDPIIEKARPHDAFEHTMRTLRGRLLGASGPRDSAGVRTDEPWRAAVESCVVEAGDDEELDIDELRRQVRAEGRPLRESAEQVREIIEQWQRTKDDKTFAMRTRFFPGGVKIPGVKWTD